jgi:hypothetical protein
MLYYVISISLLTVIGCFWCLTAVLEAEREQALGYYSESWTWMKRNVRGAVITEALMITDK